MTDFAVGDKVDFWVARNHEATVVEVGENPLTGKVRYKIEYVGEVTGATTFQWVGASAIGEWRV